MDIEKVNEALSPLGVTFGKLFRERYAYILLLELQIQDKEEDIYKGGKFLSKIDREELESLNKQRDKLIRGD